MPQTYIYKLKCARCSLHFSVYSWYDDWRATHCPECGHTRFIRWGPDTTEEFIFNYVPGTSTLAGLPDTDAVVTRTRLDR